MDESLRWVMSLVDEVTSPARNIDRALNKLEKQTAAVTRANATTGNSFIHLVAQLTAPRSAIAALSDAAGVAVEGIGKLAGATLGLAAAGYAYAAHAAEFKRQTLAALEITEGTRAAAEETFARLHAGADVAGLPTEKLDELWKMLRLVGFQAKESQDVIAGALDVGAVGGSTDALVGVVARIKETGSFNAGLLKRELKAAHLNENDLAEVFSRLSGTTHGLGIPAIRAMMDQGQIDATKGIEGILALIQQKIDRGGALGSASASITGGGLTGALAALKNDLDELFADSVDDAKPLVDALGSMRRLLDASTESGASVRRVLGDALGSIGELIAQLAQPGVLVGMVRALTRVVGLLTDIGAGGLSGFIEGVGAFLGPLLEVFGEVGDGASSTRQIAAAVGRAFGIVAGVVIDASVAIGVAIYGLSKIVGVVWDALVTFPDNVAVIWDAVVDGVDAAFDSLVDVGGDLVAGLWKGIKAGWKKLVEEFAGLVDMLPDAAKKALGIASPSRVMMGIGAFTAEGFAVGVRARGERAHEAVTELVAPPVAPVIRLPAIAPMAGESATTVVRVPAATMAATASAPRHARSTSIVIESLSVHVDGGRAHDPHALARMIADEVQRGVMSAADEAMLTAAA